MSLHDKRERVIRWITLHISLLMMIIEKEESVCMMHFLKSFGSLDGFAICKKSLLTSETTNLKYMDEY